MDMKSLRILLAFCLFSAFVAVSCEEQQPAIVAVEQVLISPADTVLEVGDTIKLIVSVLPENATNKKYALSLDNDDVIEISGDMIIAKAAGKVVLTVISDDQAKFAKTTIKVNKVKEDDNTNNNEGNGGNDGNSDNGDDSVDDSGSGDNDNTGNGDNNSETTPVVPKIDSTMKFSLTVIEKYTTETNITIDIKAPNTTVKYWVWCAEKKDLITEEGNILANEDIWALDKEVMNKMIKTFSAQDGTSYTIRDLMFMNTKKGNQNISIKPLTEGFMEIKPDTDYVIYAYAINTDGYPLSLISYTFGKTLGETVE